MGVVIVPHSVSCTQPLQKDNVRRVLAYTTAAHRDSEVSTFVNVWPHGEKGFMDWRLAGLLHLALGKGLAVRWHGPGLKLPGEGFEMAWESPDLHTVLGSGALSAWLSLLARAVSLVVC